jgi:putative spermidine/putrescine transport system permease protein/mannopine transport system permease protein
VSFGYRALAPVPVVFLALFFLWPLARVVWRSVADPSLGVGHYARILGGGPYLAVLWITVETAATVTAICLLLAYPVAYVIAQAKGTRLKVLTGLVLVPLWTSVVIRSYAWMVVFQRRGVLNEALGTLGWIDEPIRFLPGTIAVNVGMVHIMLPFMILPLVASMRGIDRSLLRAAGILGAGPFTAFRKIFLPLSLPGVLAGAALVFMMSLGFFITPALLGGPRHTMAAVLIEQQASSLLDWGMASALSTLLLLLTLAIYGVYVRLTGVAGLAGAR